VSDDERPDEIQECNALPVASRAADDLRELPIRYIRIPELERMLGVRAMTIWRWEKAGLFPPREQIGPNSVGWPEHVILAWIKTRPVGPRAPRPKRPKPKPSTPAKDVPKSTESKRSDSLSPEGQP
jgi:prophage regulatory protein